MTSIKSLHSNLLYIYMHLLQMYSSARYTWTCNFIDLQELDSRSCLPKYWPIEFSTSLLHRPERKIVISWRGLEFHYPTSAIWLIVRKMIEGILEEHKAIRKQFCEYTSIYVREWSIAHISPPTPPRSPRRVAQVDSQKSERGGKRSCDVIV